MNRLLVSSNLATLSSMMQDVVVMGDLDLIRAVVGPWFLSRHGDW